MNGVSMTAAERKRAQRARQAPERAAAAAATLETAIREAQEVLAQLLAMRPAAAPIAAPVQEPEPVHNVQPEPEQPAADADVRESPVASALGEIIGVPSDTWDAQDLDYWNEPLKDGQVELTLAQVEQICRYAEARPGNLYEQYWFNLSLRLELAAEAAEWEERNA